MRVDTVNPSVQQHSDVVEKWLLSYPKWKQRIQTIKEQLAHISIFTQHLEQAPSHGQGQKNESVLNEVIKRLRLREEELPYWEFRVKTMKDALNKLPQEEQRLIELKYVQQLNNEQLMDRFHCSSSMLYRKRQSILCFLYEELGGEQSILWVEMNRE
jgi:DNA-directed RNA polymerase specialized sigma24 family protein